MAPPDRFRRNILLIVSLILFTPLRAQDLDLTILDDWVRHSDAENTLYHYLNDQAQELLAQRKATLEDLHTFAAWQERQAEIKRTLHRLVGPFPDRTPLNARVTGTLERERFTVEKILYESQPGYYVTAALFIPQGLEGPAPAILFCSGHTANGFRSATYQGMILNLVHKGFVVLAFDPFGQGERAVYFSDPLDPYPGGPTHQHSYPGALQFVLGQSPARSMIWDGMRGIDYLVNRPEVNPDQIGVAGRSGGGTQGAYIAAFDERVAAAAPEAYITGFSRLMDSQGPQDAEQNFYHGLHAGIDHGDLLAVRAPRPALIISTTRDFFSIQGARETFEEVQHIYAAYGADDALSMAEDDAEHASTLKNREAMYGFFQRTFEMPGTPAEEEIPPFSEEELQVTPNGQVALLPGSRSIFSMIADDASTAIKALESSRATNPNHLESVRQQALLRSGYQDSIGPSPAVFAGRNQRDGYVLEKYFLQREGSYPLPYLVLAPGTPGPHPVLIYLDPEGKPAEAAALNQLESWVRAGYVVVAPDLPGFGELGPGSFRGDAFIDGVSMNVWFASILIGRSITAIQAADLNQIVEAVTHRPDVDPDRMTGVALQTLAPVLLHAAAARPSYWRLILGNALVSNLSLVTSERYDPAYLPGIVAGSLPHYDLPDLAASLAPMEITVLHPTDPSGKPAAQEALDEIWSIARKHYNDLGIPQKLSLISTNEAASFDAALNKTIVFEER